MGLMGEGKEIYRDFRLIDRHDGGQSTHAETGNDSTHHHHSHIYSAGLKGTSDEEDHGPIENGLAPAYQIPDASYQQRGHKGSNL